MPPALVGLTGGIGAGKSEALAAFERAGAATLSSDRVVHELLGTEELQARLIDRWGERAADGGRLDRSKIAEIVFDDPRELEWLESELHPRVSERVAAWRAALPDEVELAVVEVPLLFETGMERAFDAVVCVVADEDRRKERASRRGLAGLEGRSGRQLTQDEKAARATHVVTNDATLADLDARIRDLAVELTGSDSR